ncbi:MAG: sulfotransferase [Woeseiaceae bacterium]|nr:sulfotransferase [Woeseiaceae bacterium]
MFDLALNYLRSSEFEMAADLCRDALQEQPRDDKIRVLLGTVLVRQNEFAAAEKELRDVISRRPEIPKAVRELGNALIAQGKGDEAIRCYKRVIELTPDNPAAHRDLAMAYKTLGKREQAEAALDESLELDPERRELVLAMQHQNDGEYGKAEIICREILRRDPRNVNATRMLGTLARDTGKPRLAARMLRNAVKLAPEFYGARLDLARALLEIEEFDECERVLRETIRQKPDLPHPYSLLGNAYTKQGNFEEAVEVFKTALDKQPNHGPSLAGMGHALKTIGRQDESIETYRDCITRHPEFGEAYWALANLKTFRFSDDEIATMEGYVDDESLADETRVNFNYALGKACEDRGDYDQAFARYDRGNQLRRPHESYDPVQTEMVHDQIIETITPEFLAANRDHGCADNDPIFIVGLPRSGSTLIEQILASHSQVDGTLELPELPRVIKTINQQQREGKGYPQSLPHYGKDLAELGRQYLESTARYRKGAPRFTDKLPNNFASIGLIAAILPNAKVVNARRHPLDSCMGCYKQLFYSGQSFTYDLVELGEYYLEYQRMMDHWHEVVPDMVLDVHYEDMVADQEAQTRRLIEHCDLPWEVRVLRFYETDRAVITASSEQVRQPIYSKSVNSWRRFETHLAPLIEVLEPLLRKLPEDQQPAILR